MPSIYRPTLAPLIAKVRQMIADPAGASQQFSDLDIQDRLDASRDDLRYEGEQIAPSIVNIGGASLSAETIFADYYSKYQYWEDDVVLQGPGAGGSPWVVLTPTLAEPIVGHWQFEGATLGAVFTSGTVPGQLPPVFATGKVFAPFCAAAALLEFWAAALTGAYDFTSDGQSFRRSQQFTQKLDLAANYRSRAKPHTARMLRTDVLSELSTRRMRLLDSGDDAKGS